MAKVNDFFSAHVFSQDELSFLSDNKYSPESVAEVLRDVEPGRGIVAQTASVTMSNVESSFDNYLVGLRALGIDVGNERRYISEIRDSDVPDRQELWVYRQW